MRNEGIDGGLGRTRGVAARAGWWGILLLVRVLLVVVGGFQKVNLTLCDIGKHPCKTISQNMLIGSQHDSEWLYTYHRSMFNLMLIPKKSCVHHIRFCMSTYRRHIAESSQQHVSITYRFGYVVVLSLYTDIMICYYQLLS